MGSFITFLSVIISDVTPLLLSTVYKNVFDEITAVLLDACGKEQLSVDAKVSKQLNLIEPAKKVGSSPADRVAKSKETGVAATTKAEAIREAIREHYIVQHCLDTFNEIFAPIVILFVLQNFIMIVSIVVTVLSAAVPLTPAVLTLFVSNATQYFIRSTIVLHHFGRVGTAGSAIKGALLHDVEIEDCDAGTVAQLSIFFSQINCGTCNVAAGEYYSFTPGLLLTFYGILATYIAVMAQSL